jgi:hypothetical protein
MIAGSRRARALRARRLGNVAAGPPGAEVPIEAGYHKLEAQEFRALVREGTIATVAFGMLALALEPLETLFAFLFGWLFGGRAEEDDGEAAPDYSMAERIPEEET